MRDLFDVLDIGTREDSYTSLLGALFEEKPKWARDYFSKALRRDRPDKPVRVRVRPGATLEGGQRIIPDLVLAFGEPVTDVWLIEAKIRAKEGPDQLKNQESEEVRSVLLEKLETQDAEPGWHHSYLTLEGEEPTGSTAFGAISFEPLNDIFPKQAKLPDEILPAYHCLRKRLNDYYKAREREPAEKNLSLREYLDKTGGLIDEEARFSWLSKWATKKLGMRRDIGTTSNPGHTEPFCQLRDDGWQGTRYPEDGQPLRECFDVHLEMHLRERDVHLMLHYETNPYMSGLRNRKDVPEGQLEGYLERRKRFADALAADRERIQRAGWTLTTRYVNQLARFERGFSLNGTVGEFRGWTEESSEAMRRVVNRALKEG